jgi:5-methylcytosine-specific restriction endonuclease McrA
MGPLQSPEEYLFNLQATSQSEAKRLWRKQIKESWDHKCAYCGSEEDLTLDHVIPQSKGGLDITRNVYVAANLVINLKGTNTGSYGMFSRTFIVKINLI